MRSPIALLTDFSPADPFAGVMKGVILSLEPRAVVVDLAHGIPRHDVRAASLALAAAEPHFPRGSVFVAVVDPGVGAARRILAARSRGRFFLAPDNGLLGFLKGRSPAPEVRSVRTRALFWRDPPSRTFHGRDVLAPVAARLARGMPFARVGPPAGDFKGAPLPAPTTLPDGSIEGEVLGFDAFGNAFTNLPTAGSGAVVCRGRRIPVRASYAEARKGSPVAVASSAGGLEIAIREGSARSRLRLAPGDRARLLPGVSPRMGGA